MNEIAAKLGEVGLPAPLADLAARTAPVVVARPWPRPEDWAGLLEEAGALDGERWAGWDPEPGFAQLGDLVARESALDHVLEPA